MRAHLVQFDIVWEDKAANHAIVERMVRGADPAPGDLVVLPELFDTGFSLDVARNDDESGQTESFLTRLATRYRIFLHGSHTRRRPDGMGLNRAIILDPRGEVVARYDKVHPFSYGRESERFVGGAAPATYRWVGSDRADSLTVGVAICYDLRFPELFRAELDAGANTFAIGANWPRERAEHWRALLIARAIENQAFVLGVNRTGSDPHLSYAGGSMVVGPTGLVLGELGEAPGVLSVEIDPGVVGEWRVRFPAWKDRKRDIWAS